MEKLSFLISCFIVLMAIQSCEPPVVFEEPYLNDVAALKSFPDNFQGIYACQSDSTIILINDHTIYAESLVFFEESISKLSAKDNCTLIGDEIYISDIQECIPFEYISEDSIRGHYYLVDSLFHISSLNAVKPFKGHLVLIQYFSQDDWVLSLLSLDEDYNISFRTITENSDLDKLSQITNMEKVDNNRNSKPTYRVRPTKTEFEQIFEDYEIFIECEYLIRVNLENDSYIGI